MSRVFGLIGSGVLIGIGLGILIASVMKTTEQFSQILLFFTVVGAVGVGMVLIAINIRQAVLTLEAAKPREPRRGIF